MNMTKARFDILDSFQFKCFDGEYSYFGDDHICFRFKGIIREFADLTDHERYSSAARKFFNFDYFRTSCQPTLESVKGKKKFFFTENGSPRVCVQTYYLRMIWKLFGKKVMFCIPSTSLEPVYATTFDGSWEVFLMPLRYTWEVWERYCKGDVE